ncbi:velvet factor-domain-containing protein [Cercophora newfieldiana]|uniref:Velvet factor-domain-containing protein n=1 Tax=Cercophora newfieldiana TaxID=92897 RepID=A0AA40CRB0_9PEZI|nr:velvet factor-domain-containing protein [Cercophora newfieldiana]
MSAVVEFAPHDFGRHTMLDGHHHHQPPRLPPIAMISTAAAGHGSGMANGGVRDAPYPGPGPRPYYSDYATPSPVGQTPPQLPAPSSDPHSMSRRPIDVRRSPAQSSTASDRSSDEAAQELRLRQMNVMREHQGPAPISRPYHHQHSPPMSHYDSNAAHPRPHINMQQPPYPSAPHRRSLPPLPQSPPSTQSSASPRQEGKSMSISNLLSSDTSNGSKQPVPPPAMQTPSLDYRIIVRQQPFAARSCGFGERDRRVIDPPPIVQLTVLDDEGRPVRPQAQFSVVHCSIWDERGSKDMSSMPEDFRQQRRLMGTLVASPFVGLDEKNEEGTFFCFPDLSCRTPGTFRLKFALVVLDPKRMIMGEKSPIVATAMSDPFQVYNAKDFPGMQASTALTKRLKEQGCLISIKKGNDKSSAAHDRDESGGDEDEDDSKPRPRKKQKRSSA